MLFFLFILIFINLLGCTLPKVANSFLIRETILKATLLFSCMVFISTEGLSYFNLLNTCYARIVWVIFLLISFGVALKRNSKFYSIIYQEIKQLFASNNRLLITLCILSIPLLFLAIYVPTSNNDSLNYHLPRILYWINNQNVDYYATLNGRQIYFNPFAEYFILQFQLVTQTPYFANLPQFISMVGTCIVVSLITELLFNNKRISNFAVILIFCLPIGLFESTTSQNDYIATFYATLSLYFLIIISTKKLNLEYVFYLLIAFSFSGLTKYSGWVFILPFVVYYALKITVKYKFQILKYIPMALCITGIILGISINRNLQSFESPLGPKKGEELYYNVMNSDISIKNSISTTIKNTATSIAIPIKKVNYSIRKIIILFHDKILKFDINKEGNNYLNMPFSNNFLFHEDGATNFIHSWLFLFSFLLLFYRRDKFAIAYCLMLVAGYLIFSTLFTWQLWHSRLELVWYVLMCPYLAYVLYELLKKELLIKIIKGTLIVYACAIIFLNPPKQLIPVYNYANFKLPFFISNYDIEQIKKQDTLLSHKINHIYNKVSGYGLTVYLLKTDSTINKHLQDSIAKAMQYRVPKNIYLKNYSEKMSPFELSIQQQNNNMLSYITKDSARVATSFLAGTREYLILFGLSNKQNIVDFRNIAYPKILKNIGNNEKPFNYDYLITNNIDVLPKIDSATVKQKIDFGYYILYEFYKPQSKKYLVKDILQNFQF